MVLPRAGEEVAPWPQVVVCGAGRGEVACGARRGSVGESPVSSVVLLPCAAGWLEAEAETSRETLIPDAAGEAVLCAGRRGEVACGAR
ncbi:hypothetical protein GCM10023178_52010 [Actinomadura luteofluorescens]